MYNCKVILLMEKKKKKKLQEHSNYPLVGGRLNAYMVATSKSKVPNF